MTFERSEDYELLTFLTLIALFVGLELAIPARRIHRARQLPFDLLAALVALVGVSATRWVWKQSVVGSSVFSGQPWQTLAALPSPIKVLVAIVCVDFSLYWVHRAMHTAALWRTHLLHHSPEVMYWLAGLRTSLAHVFFFTTPQVLIPFVGFGASALEGAIVVGAINLAQFVTHCNARLSLGLLGRYVIVTPAVHRLHHARDTYHASNFASLLVVWDRLFGTYRDPAQVTDEVELGLGQDGARATSVRGLVGV